MDNEAFYRILNEKYGVRLPFPQEQDWEWCAGDHKRTADYIRFYNEYSENMDDWQRYLAVNLIVQGLEDMLEVNEDTAYTDKLWLQLKEILLKDDHRYTIVYWSCIGQEPEDRWRIAERMRELL